MPTFLNDHTHHSTVYVVDLLTVYGSLLSYCHTDTMDETSQEADKIVFEDQKNQVRRCQYVYTDV